MFLIIDNYDSFTYNLVHFLGDQGAELQVYRNDSLTAEEALALAPEGIVLSPGPCDPDQAGICVELIRKAGGRVPILGVCLGHQSIAQAYGGRIVRAPKPMHGKLSRLRLGESDLFADMPANPEVTRYHSLVVERDGLPACLRVTASTEDGLIMGLAHRDHPVHGVQFHPESIKPDQGRQGKALLGRFLRLARAYHDRTGAASGIGNPAPSATAPSHFKSCFKKKDRVAMTDVPRDMKKILAPLADGNSLSAAEAEAAFDIMMSGEAKPAQIGAFLMALRLRGETVEEITAAAQVMRAKARHVTAPDGAIDIVGTGGDVSGSFNISTASAVVVAGCGVPVAKHGNKAITSKSGAADILTALGVKLDADFDIVERAIREANIGFLMATRHHSAMRHVGPVRQELGLRTIFNILGPLSNPALVKRYMMGTFALKWVEPMATVLGKLGAERAWVVHGSDGMDEITTTGATTVCEWRDGAVHQFKITPADAGLPTARAEDLKGGDPQANAAALWRLLDGEPGPYRDVVLLNAAAALVVAEKATDLRNGAELAAKAIDDGAAKRALERLIAVTNG